MWPCWGRVSLGMGSKVLINPCRAHFSLSGARGSDCSSMATAPVSCMPPIKCFIFQGKKSRLKKPWGTSQCTVLLHDFCVSSCPNFLPAGSCLGFLPTGSFLQILALSACPGFPQQWASSSKLKSISLPHCFWSLFITAIDKTDMHS